MRGNVQALFGGEGLVFLSNQDLASYPTLFVRIALLGRLLWLLQRLSPKRILVAKSKTPSYAADCITCLKGEVRV